MPQHESPARKSSSKVQPHTRRLLAKAALVLGAVGGIAALMLAAYVFLIVKPNLPSVEALADYQPKLPLRVYTAENVLIGEFGEERRDFIPIAQIPGILKKAVIAIEDDHFYEHEGVYYPGVIRAAIANIGNSRSQGASTITMQVARTFFLTRQKTYTRKISEVMLAFKIEEALTKDQILELYMNQIYLGERAYGFGTAARMYFGKPVNKISLAEAAMLAGLPQSPAAANPVANFKRAKARQMQVLRRMLDLEFINQVQFDKAAAEKLIIYGSAKRFGSVADHAAELVRQSVYEQFKEETYTRGINVITTLRKVDQDAAYAALRRGVIDYDRRQGYRGPEDYIDLPRGKDDRNDAIDDILAKHPDSGELLAAVVLAASPKQVRAEIRSGQIVEISGEGLRLAAAALAPTRRTSERIRPGTVIRVTQDTRERWTIVQLPQVQAAFVSIHADDGAIRALVGGFDFQLNKLDHVTQAWRQPGSSIKPFIYSAALEKGLSPGTLINDAPLSADGINAPQGWTPQNDDGSTEGPITMRTALKKSKNLVSIRILRTVGPDYARDYLGRFGLDPQRHPDNLTMTLGTGSVTPLQLAGGYAVFANGGNKVAPYLIEKMTDARGNPLWERKPEEPGRVIDPRNAWLIDSMLRDVTHSGTGYLAGQRLARADVAGKTGTTNDSHDGWFAGYGSDVVAVAWMGYSQPKSLGNREYGGTVALPIWADYMRTALRGKPDLPRTMPAGLAQVGNDLAYQEYAGDSATAVRQVDVDGIFNLWDRLFGSGQRQPVANPEQEQKRKEERAYQELYGGG